MAKKWKDIVKKSLKKKLEDGNDNIPCSGTGDYYNIEEYERRERMEKEEKRFDLNLSVNELNVTLGALAKLPFEQSAFLIRKIQVQVKGQQLPKEDLVLDNPVEEEEES